LSNSWEPLKLRYAKAWYGPYAENLRHVLLSVEGHFISGYTGEADSTETILQVLPDAVREAEDLLAPKPDTQERFDRVAKLVDGYESPYGLELLSTVHWIATEDGVEHRDAIAEAVGAWGHRKRQFSREQIDLAVDHLHSLGWIGAPAAG